ncbi:MAG TPA: alpha/beta fold hydrolase [Thermoanaerobaculia bacterium]|nr:alpha/beta fold hydrolase [Thermoanaerobaculia bacterium]
MGDTAARHSRGRSLRARSAGIAVCLAGLSVSAASGQQEQPPPTPTLAATNPGDLLHVESFPAPEGSKAWKIVYFSIGLSGEPITVSGLLIAPDAPAPDGGRPIVAWAHPTTGVSESCAPSLFPDPWKKIPGLSELIGRGFVVAATDYPGLGMPGPHPYLIGESEARAVIDSVRAARRIPECGAGSRFAAWGHSQGGHAALFAGQLAGAYAPELTLVGVAAIAPATDLEQLLKEDIGEELGRVLTAFAISSWSEVYNVSADEVINPPARAVVRRVSRDCVENILEGLKVEMDGWSLTPRFLKPAAYTRQPWRRILDENRPGQRPAGAPVYVAQGVEDKLVRPEVTSRFVDGLCARGERVTFEKLEHVNHLAAGFRSASSAIGWIADRFAGRPQTTTCPGP